MEKYLEKLNPAQYEAATTIDGRILILAGAGSGKTATLVARVAYMLDNGIPPKSILLLTFTNKAAKEMQSRILSLIGPAASDVTACTFHSYCANFMRHNAKSAGLSQGFTVIDGPDTVDVMNIARQEYIEIQKSKGRDYKHLVDFPTAKRLLTYHSTAINNTISLIDTLKLMGEKTYIDEILAIDKIFTDYKLERELFDYDDLMFYTKQILSNYEHIRKAIDAHFEYISCDEFQDTNVIQNDILNLITQDYKNLAVVGDDNQSIYGWRCAEIKNIIDFNKNYSDCKTIVLNENYRSSQEILNLANHTMDHATEGIKKNLHAQFASLKPELILTNSCNEEDDFIYNKICELHANGIPYNDMAVIVRSAKQSFTLEALFNRNELPFEKFGGIKFTERSSVKDIISFLRVVTNPKDEIAWFRILQLYPGIGKSYAKKISAKLALSDVECLNKLYEKRCFSQYLKELKETIDKLNLMNLTEELNYLIDDYYKKVCNRNIELADINETMRSYYYKELEEELEIVTTLKYMANDYKDARHFLADFVLEASQPKIDNNDALNITTVHSAKGLEYKVVFVMDVIDDVFPKCEEKDDENSEELRVFYVAITRAKEFLYLMAPSRYLYKLPNGSCQLSRFINYDDVINTLSVNNIRLLGPMRNRKSRFSYYC